MARQEGACWRCGARWVSEVVRRTTLRAIAGGRPARALGDLARAEARLQADRWTNEGGSVGSEAAGTPPGAAVVRG
jgi:hypothetical protein